MAPRLSARVFYGIIIAGVLLGMAAAVGAGWLYLESDSARPTGRRIWDGDAATFVIPICVMVGATFGGMLGVGAAVLIEIASRRRKSPTR
jgi:hypothetical protein